MILSVIIVNYRVKYFLQLCLCSVKKAIAGLDAEISYSTEDSPSKPIPSKGGGKRLQRAGRPNVPKTFGSRAR